MKKLAKLVVAAVLSATSLALMSPSAWAVPSYSRNYGVECSTCHTMWGALNGAGVTFRLSGYRAINGKDLPLVDRQTEKGVVLSNGLLNLPPVLPLSMITGVGFDYRNENHRASDSTKNSREGLGITLEDASIFLTGPLGNHLSYFMEFPMFETKAWEFTPTGLAAANDKTKGNIQFDTSSPAFEVAKFWWNNLFDAALPRDSFNLLAGVTHLPLAYSPGKVRLSVNQYLVYERRALDYLSRTRPADLLGNKDDSLFRLSEPQFQFEVNGMFTPFGQPLGKKETFWTEYHAGVANGSNTTFKNNSQMDVYARLVNRWYGQSLGVFVFYSPNTYDADMQERASIATSPTTGIMSGLPNHNSVLRVGPDMTLSLAPFGIPVWAENQVMYNREDDPTGFGRSFEWWGGFDQLNWQISKKAITYGRYDWVSGSNYNDTTVTANGVTGKTNVTPREWDVVAGAQYLVNQNMKLIGEFRHHEFKDGITSASIVDNGFTTRFMVGF